MDDITLNMQNLFIDKLSLHAWYVLKEDMQMMCYTTNEYHIEAFHPDELEKVIKYVQIHGIKLLESHIDACNGTAIINYTDVPKIIHNYLGFLRDSIDI
uniref:Uncharacterized protein n=1 Tax=Megaviridae environmental sample TaxID=1737588 RepID=A0A5J6VJP8_9VIRU|nr:MAG: hypothetical protein [Megaviridae environmental sample]